MSVHKASPLCTIQFACSIFRKTTYLIRIRLSAFCSNQSNDLMQLCIKYGNTIIHECKPCCRHAAVRIRCVAWKCLVRMIVFRALQQPNATNVIGWMEFKWRKQIIHEITIVEVNSITESNPLSLKGEYEFVSRGDIVKQGENGRGKSILCMSARLNIDQDNVSKISLYKLMHDDTTFKLWVYMREIYLGCSAIIFYRIRLVDGKTNFADQFCYLNSINVGNEHNSTRKHFIILLQQQ